MEIGDINSHGLLTHSRLVRVSRGLKAERKGNSIKIISKGIYSTGYYNKSEIWLVKFFVFFPER